MGTGKRQVKVIVEGREYLVEVGDLDERPVRATVNQRTYQVQVGDAAPASQAKPGNGQRTAPPAAAPAPAPAAAVPAPVASLPGAKIVAPMPGDIVEVLVVPGQQVAVDQSICVLEAMKMKNIIRSPQAGRVAQVLVQPGQAVAFGAPLVTFE